MNTKTAATIVRSPNVRQTMQDAELAWWKNYMRHPTAIHRMYSLYGIRYGEYFWSEMHDPGRLVEFGSGPVPVALLFPYMSIMLCDTLYPQYIQHELVYPGMDWKQDAAEVPTGEFDCALLLNVLDHTPEPEVLVREAYRSLKPGGKALVFVHLVEGGDDKHRKTTMAETWGQLIDAGFKDEQHWLKPATVFDPPAFFAVMVK